MVFKIWRQLFYNFLSSCEGLLVLQAAQSPAVAETRKTEFHECQRGKQSEKKKKRKEGIGKSPLCSWQTEVRVGFPKVLPSTKSDLQRVHRDTSQGWFADLQNIYKGSHEGGTLRHNSPYTRHIHWKTGVQCNLQCNRDVSKSSSSSWVVTDNVAAEGDLRPQPCTSSCTC